MPRLAGFAATLLLAVGVAPAFPLGELSGFALAGATTLRAIQGGYGQFVNPGPDATLVDVRFAPSIGSAVFWMKGPAGSHWTLVIDGQRLISDNPNLLAVPTGGPYWVYVAAEEGPVSVTLTLQGLAGSTDVTLVAAASEVAHLVPVLPEAGPGPGLQKFSGRQPFDGEVYSWIGTRHAVPSPAVVQYELRWSTPEGIVFCWAGVTFIAGVPSLHQNKWASGTFSDGGHRLPLDLTYFRQSGAIVFDDAVVGYWIARAPGDSPTDAPLTEPLGWNATNGHELLDQDAVCAREQAQWVVDGMAGLSTRWPDEIATDGAIARRVANYSP